MTPQKCPARTSVTKSEIFLRSLAAFIFIWINRFSGIWKVAFIFWFFSVLPDKCVPVSLVLLFSVYFFLWLSGFLGINLFVPTSV